MRKILASLLVAAMVLGLVGTAFAGYSDTAKHADEKSIDKATAFSWMKGYPDGSFKPAGNITRAEFAAVVVRALGLEAAASSTAGLATKFKDVASTHWAAGYINVATNKGVIKGYPDGTFKPEANVTNAEAITMVVRALSREADAVGEWPVGHITVAAANNIIGTGFASNALATRADVARYVSKAADVKHKELTTNGWVESADKTFIKYNNLEKITGEVTSTDTSAKTVTMTVGGTANTYTLDANYLIAGGTSLIDIKGYSVDAFRNKDTSKLVFIEPSTTTTVVKGDIRAVGSDYFYLYDNTTKYEMKTAMQGNPAVLTVTASIIRNGSTVTMGSLKVDDAVTAFMGSDGKISYINARGYDFYRAVVTDTYTAGTPNSITIRYWDSTNSRFDTKTFTLSTDCKVELNGADSTFASLKKGDVVSVAFDTNNNSVATILNATNKTVTGKVTAKRTTVGEDLTRYFMSLDGVEYRFEGTSEIKDSDQTSSGATIYGMVKVGQTVTVNLSQRNRIRVTEFVSGVADMGRIKTFVVGTSGSYDTWVMDMKGTDTTYEVSKDANGTSRHSTLRDTYLNQMGVERALRPGDFVALTLDTDNRISGVELLVNPWAYAAASSVATLGNVYGGDKIVTINNVAYLVTNDTLLYVNGTPGSLSSLAKDQKAAVRFNPGNELKLKALIADTFARMDSAAITLRRATVKINNVDTPAMLVEGWDKATENFAKIEVRTLADAVLGSDISDDAGGVRAPASMYTAASITNRGSNTGYNGGFRVTLTGANIPAAGTTIKVVVTDRHGNTTSSTFVAP